MLIIAIFAGCALLLAAIGIYGVIAATVQQSTREIGVRMALGASSQRVARGVLLRSMLLVGAGALIGTVLALILTRFMQSMLYDVAPTDPATLAAVIAVLCSVGAVAAYIPARRAAHIDPGITLRAD
jgi:ABC-type antimicrobial peptide transport system permease subunit